MIALLSDFVAAQPPVARVTGTVRDDGGKPVLRATVVAHNPDQAPSSQTASTDAKGRFAFLGLRRGRWTFTVEAPGFLPGYAITDLVGAKQTSPIEVKLQRRTHGVADRAPLPLDTQDIQHQIDAAEAAAAAGEIDRSITAYRELLARVPALTSIYMRVGRLLEAKGDVAAALESYTQLQRLEPEHAGAAEAIARLKR
jgi:tetratricopeptide (TPR) repeat protein